MQDITADTLQIAYTGPATDGGRMSMLTLGGGLAGHALLVERVGLLLYGEQVTLQTEVDPSFEAGSLIIPVYIVSNTVHHAETLLSGQGAVAFGFLLALLGFFGIDARSLYELFKRFKGRQIEKPDDVERLRDLKLDLAIELLIRIYNDAEVQKHLRRTINPLHQEGIEEFQTRRNGLVLNRVTKSDLRAADEAELEDFSSDEEIELDIEKSAWRRDLAWHFNDGRTRFDAKIDDDLFWKRIDQGEPFSGGDRLRVHLRTTAKRTVKGLLKVERRIPKVISVDHARRGQRGIFDQDDRENS